MTFRARLTEQSVLMWRFLGFFQKPLVRCLHATIIVLVACQVLSSMGMRFSRADLLSGGVLSQAFSWYHIGAGLLVVGIGTVFVFLSLNDHGFRYFFPYLWGDTARLKQDILQSLRFKLIPPAPKGLACAVQGLGLGALVLVAFSGLLWFVLWYANAPYANVARETHKSLTGLIELYFIGHGAMALLHFVWWQKHLKK